MIYTLDLTDVLSDVVASLPRTIEIISSTDLGGTQELIVKDLLHARPLKYQNFIIGGNNYSIQDYQGNDTLIMKGAEPITANSFQLNQVYFNHGTPTETNVELRKIADANDKTPMVWLMENFTEHFYNDPTNPLERMSRLRLFILTQAQPDTWLTSDAYHNSIVPMRRLAFMLLHALQIFKIDCSLAFKMHNVEYDIINYAKFGVYITNKGSENAMLDKLAGVELSINLPMYKIAPACPV